MGLLDLPNIPPDLRSIQPFLQRADELKTQDPIVAYWCAYHAAQIGISLKSKAPGSRELLFSLLSKLEHMKAAIGPSDAIDQEAASAAYVENFAFKVFSLADNEDRRGQATRSTAKKFLAAANFLEVLQVFPRSEVSDTIDEKIRYSKWKASDIAKAFREGRKPTPGPAGSQEPAVFLPTADPTPFPADSGGFQSPSSVATSTTAVSHPAIISSPLLHDDPLSTPPSTPPRKLKPAIELPGGMSTTLGIPQDVNTPGAWSTAATPGTAPVSHAHFGQYPPFELSSPSVEAKNRMDLRQNGADNESEADTSFEESNSNAEDLGPTSNAPIKSVRWTPSVIGGLSSTDGSPPVSPGSDLSSGDPHPYPGPPPPHSNVQPRWGSFQAPGLPQIYAPPAPPPAPSQIYGGTPFVGQNHGVQRTSPPAPIPSYAPRTQPSAPVVPQFELSPALISQAQKHCRFAISSLDYEDLEQARRELRAALSILGNP